SPLGRHFGLRFSLRRSGLFDLRRRLLLGRCFRLLLGRRFRLRLLLGRGLGLRLSLRHQGPFDLRFRLGLFLSRLCLYDRSSSDLLVRAPSPGFFCLPLFFSNFFSNPARSCGLGLSLFFGLRFSPRLSGLFFVGGSHLWLFILAMGSGLVGVAI